MFERIVETSSYVQSFAIEERIYLLSDKRIQVFEHGSKEKVDEIQVFDKGGSARSFIMDGSYIYCQDFVHLHIIEKDTLDTISKLQLGTDLSSDICAMTMDERHVYAGIRNGGIVRIEKGNWMDWQHYPLSQSSMWDIKISGREIFAVNVQGQLLVIDTGSMSVDKVLQAHKQNAKSICVLDNMVVTASQDKSMAFWDRGTLEPVKVKKRTHKKAFRIVGVWKQNVMTVSFPCGEIKVWDMTTLDEKKTVPITGCLSGKTCIKGSNLYLSSRAIDGIDRASVEELVRPRLEIASTD